MMILTDKEIRKLCENKELPLITPFDEDSLQSESYDLSIGNTLTIFKKEIRCLDLSDQSEIDDIYEEIDIPLNGYVLSPKEYVLVTLKERITIPEYITAHIRPRTRYTRLGLLISDQHCNSTYSGILRIGVYNVTNYAIRLERGLHMAQIVFEELKSIPASEKLYKNKKNATYQNESNFIGAKFSDEFDRDVEKAVKIVLEED